MEPHEIPSARVRDEDVEVVPVPQREDVGASAGRPVPLNDAGDADIARASVEAVSDPREATVAELEMELRKEQLRFAIREARRRNAEEESRGFGGSAGHTPGPRLREGSIASTMQSDPLARGSRMQTESVEEVHRRGYGTPAMDSRGEYEEKGRTIHVKDPDPFYGQTIKEAQAFLHALEYNFALNPHLYKTNQTKIIYATRYLKGHASEAWHSAHSLEDVHDGMTFLQFRQFVFDAVEDPVNRAITVMCEYDKAHQRENQSAQAFATYLADLEEQISDYTEAQRSRHLLAKLKEETRNELVRMSPRVMPRRDIISNATRIETTEGKSSKRKSTGTDKGDPSEKLPRYKKSRRSEGGTSASYKGEGAAGSQGQPKPRVPYGSCFGCGETGHLRKDCPKAQGSRVRSVAVPNPQSEGQGKGRGPAKTRN